LERQIPLGNFSALINKSPYFFLITYDSEKRQEIHEEAYSHCKRKIIVGAVTGGDRKNLQIALTVNITSRTESLRAKVFSDF
jgi:hypothetical protein